MNDKELKDFFLNIVDRLNDMGESEDDGSTCRALFNVASAIDTAVAFDWPEDK